MFAVNPRASWLYFTKDAFDVGRIGNSQLLGNQSLHAALTRGHLSLSSLHFDLVCAVLLCVGVTLATVAYRRSSALLAVLICAATGLMLSPISWTHHYVWIVPVLIWLVAGVDRPAWGELWALAAALPFIVVLPFTSSGSGVLWYVRANAVRDRDDGVRRLDRGHALTQTSHNRHGSRNSRTCPRRGH